MFVDHAIITVKAGDGGHGCSSMRREKYVPKGGPDGGDGGRGGSVIAIADPNVSTLLDVQYTRKYAADNGAPGGAKQMTGADGEDVEIRLPAGTLIYLEPRPDEHGAPTGDASDRPLLHDLAPGERVVLARGGKGGLGNEHFKSSTNQTPTQATPGEPGEEKRLRLQLKLIADVGLVGLPNAGKSTLLSAATAARPKVADYPFTTLSPQLGIAELDLKTARGKTRRLGTRRLVLADIPGLIEGAAGGAGLGHDFLRHVERTRVLVHVIDIEPPDGSDPVANYHLIRKELFDYAPALAEKPEIIAINKVDLLPGADDAAAAVALVRRELQLGARDEAMAISGVTGQGVPELLEACWSAVQGVTPAAERC